ncbi:hypothetical protein [Streptomyces sp. NPDC005784]|uniref:hypothetical protein n=1 Tax=Streptomyces sp. NPDC005784 TaxID=3364731 RepID=UPI0036AECA3E
MRHAFDFSWGKMKARFIVPLLATGVLLVPAAAASAAPSGNTGRAVAKIAAFPVWCKFQGEKPFQVTHGGPLYAQGHYSGCSTPAPDQCRAQVDLQEYVRDGYWRAVKHEDSLWTRCSGRYTTPPLRCVHDGEKETYNTQVTLQVEYHGRFSEAGIADTGNTVMDC